MRTACLVTVFLLFAGCGDQETKSKPQPTAPPIETTESGEPNDFPSPPPAATIPHKALNFTASDGKRLRGLLTPARDTPAPAVVLIHQFNGGPNQWDPLIPDLHDAGFTTLTYTSRDPAELDESLLARDVAGAVTALRKQPGVDPDRIALTGASVGGTTVAYVLGTKPAVKVRGGVGLSAGESVRLIDLGAEKRFHPHDLLLIADERESLDSDNLDLDAQHKGITKYTSPTDGHGVALLEDRAIRDRVIAWLAKITKD